MEDSPFIGYCYQRPQKRRPLNRTAFPLQVSITPGFEGRLCLLFVFFFCATHPHRAFQMWLRSDSLLLLHRFSSCHPNVAVCGQTRPLFGIFIRASTAFMHVRRLQTNSETTACKRALEKPLKIHPLPGGLDEFEGLCYQ